MTRQPSSCAKSLDALIAWAWDCGRRAGSSASGAPPTHLVVTRQEYEMLVRSNGSYGIEYGPDLTLRVMGMAVCAPGHWCAAMRALEADAYAYAWQTSQTTGCRPREYPLTAEAYACLQQHVPAMAHLDATGEIRLFGMRVRSPQASARGEG